MSVRFIISGKEYRDRTYGNTYHSLDVEDLKTGKKYHQSMKYGDVYSMALQNASILLEKHDVKMPKKNCYRGHPTDPLFAPWAYGLDSDNTRVLIQKNCKKSELK